MIIEAEDLRKNYRYRGREVEAVRGVNLRLSQAGEIFGFLGPNGAGKTTTVRVLATLTRPTGGRVRVVDCELPRETARARRHIGYVSQAGGVDDGMPVRANLMLQARLCGLSKAAAVARTDEVLEALGLRDVADRTGRTLSGGQRRRLGLALGLVHEPELLFLDEPTLGLDPAARAMLWAEIRSLRSRGTTVFLTTHYLDEADELCDRVAIIDQGRVVAEGTPAELKRQVRGDAVTVAVSPEHRDAAREVLSGLPFTDEIRDEPSTLRVYVLNGGDAVPALLRELEHRQLPVKSIGLESVSLDDVFLKQTGYSLSAADAPAMPAPGATGWSAPARGEHDVVSS